MSRHRTILTTAVTSSRAAGVVLPKLERADELAELRGMLPDGAVVVAGLETARGVADCGGGRGCRAGSHSRAALRDRIAAC